MTGSARPAPPPGLAKWLSRGVALGLLTVHPDDRARGRVAYRLVPRGSRRTAGARKLAERVLLDAAERRPSEFTVFRDNDDALWFGDETGAASEPSGGHPS